MFFSLCVEAKSELLEAIRNHQEFLTDPERNQGRLTKEDKVKLFYGTKDSQFNILNGYISFSQSL